MKLDEHMRVDGQTIGMIKDKETSAWIDYFFAADVWCKDPRFQSRFMKIGECRGLFRIDKVTLGAELLFPMAGDEAGSRFDKAALKVLEAFGATGSWPDRIQFASG